MTKKKEEVAIHKIDIDEEKEPIIVTVPESEVVSGLKEDIDRELIERYKNNPSIGDQITMKNLFPEDKLVEKRQRVLRAVFTWVFFAVVISVLAFTFYNDFFSEGKINLEWDKISKILRSEWPYAILAVFALFFYYFNKFAKLTIFAKKITGKWHIKACIKTTIVGIYYNNVTPLAVGGQPFEIYHLTRNGITGGASVCLPMATYFLHQIAASVLGILALVLFSVDAFDISNNFAELSASISVLIVLAWVGVVLGFIMPVTVLLFCLMPKFTSKIVALIFKLGGKLKIVKDVEASTEKTVNSLVQNANCFKTILHAPVSFISTFILSFCEHLALSSIAYFTLKFFGYDLRPNPNGILEWVSVIEISIIIYSAVSFIPTPGNAGAADLSFYALFKTSVVSIAGMSFSAMIFWRILSYYSLILIGFIYLSASKKKEKRKALLKDLE